MKYFVSVIIMIGISGILLSQGLEKKNDLSKVCISEEQMKLYAMMMKYREKNNLPVIPISRSLTFVAQQHCIDLYTNKPDNGPGCNAHSWSNKGTWTSCCYTPDHKQASCMWNKPKELTGYTGSGFEIAAGSSNPIYNGYVMTAEYALSSWQKSKFHNAVVINQSPWNNLKWKSIGIGIYRGFAVVWFGTENDTENKPEVCR